MRSERKANPPSPEHRRPARGAMLSRARTAWLGTFAANGLILACNVATGILVARLLLPEGRGVLAAIIFWPGLLWSLGMLSLEQTVAHRIAKTEADNRTVAMTAVYLAAVFASAIALLALFALPYLLGSERRTWWSVSQLYAITWIPIHSLGTVMLALDYGELRLIRYNIWRIVSALTYLAGLITIWATDNVTVTAALLAAWFSVVAIALTQMVFRSSVFIARPSAAEARGLLIIAGRFHSTNLVALLRSHIDRLVVMLFLNDVAIGLYVVALTWAGTGLHTIYASFSTVMFPYLSAEVSPERQRALLARGLRFACLLLAIGTAALAALTAWLLPLLFGNSFEAAVPAAFALVAAQLPGGLRQIIVQSLRGLGRVTPGTLAEALAIGTFLICAWPLIHALGILGVGLALFVGNLASLLYLVSYLGGELGLRLADWWGLNLVTLREAMQLGRETVRSALPAGKSD